MKKYQMWVEVPFDVDLASLAADALYDLEILKTLYPNPLIAPGTDIQEPRKVFYCEMSSDSSDLLTYFNLLIITYGLDWQIRYMLSAKKTKPIIVDGEVVGYEAEVLVEPDMIALAPFIKDYYAEYEEDGTPIGSPLPKTEANLARWQGWS